MIFHRRTRLAIQPRMRSLFLLVGVVVAAWACSPPCDPVDLTAFAVCHRADAGVIAANAPFTLVAESYASGGATCTVTVDGGSIHLDIPYQQSSCSSAGAGVAAPRAPTMTNCEVPALPEGTYVISTNPPTTLTLPQGDAGVIANCAGL